jgi:hypothetical protein
VFFLAIGSPLETGLFQTKHLALFAIPQNTSFAKCSKLTIRPEINLLNLALLVKLGAGNVRNGVVMNDEAGLPYPDWRGPFQEVICELDREKLPGKAGQGRNPDPRGAATASTIEQWPQ